jgi:hypothetical protein
MWMRKEQSSTGETKSCNTAHEWSREQERLAAQAVRETAHDGSQD